MGSHFKTSQGSQFYYEDVGSGPPLLALPGIGGGTVFFSEWAKLLETSHRIISVDLPGIGNSISGPALISFDTWLIDLVELIQEKIGEPVTLLGHSLGTMLALTAWEIWPRWIRSMIFVAGLPKVRPEITQRLTQRIQAIAEQGMSHLGPKVSPGIFSATTRNNYPEIVSRYETYFEAQSPTGYVRSIELLLRADLTSLVPTITVPCLAVAGIDDSYAPPSSLRSFIAAIPSPCTLEILEQCAHMPFFEVPEQFALVVKRFMDSLPN